MTAESSLEARVAHVEGILDEVRSRFGSLENRMDRLEVSMNGRFDNMNGRLDKLESSITMRMDRADDRQNTFEAAMRTQFQWLVGLLVGLIVPMWASVILAILLRT